MASTHATDSMKFEVPRWTVYLIVAVLVLAAAYVLGTTQKKVADKGPPSTIGAPGAETKGEVRANLESHIMNEVTAAYGQVDVRLLNLEEARQLSKIHNSERKTIFLEQLSEVEAEKYVLVLMTDPEIEDSRVWIFYLDANGEIDAELPFE